MSRKVALFFLFICTSTLLGQEAAPMPPAIQPVADAAPPVLAVPPLRADPCDLPRLGERLKAAREGLEAERQKLAQPSENTYTIEALKLRLKLAELLNKLNKQEQEKAQAAKRAPASSDPWNLPPGSGQLPAGVEPLKVPGLTPEPLPPPQRTDTPVDPMALAQSLFRTGDYEASLASFRLLNLNKLGRPDRAAVQYLMASCLRKLGRTDQAAALYREVIKSHDDDSLAEFAQWQLSAMQWRRELQTQLDQVRQRRQALELK
jgi:tetratricopeptide (TPR) repeat protein